MLMPSILYYATAGGDRVFVKKVHVNYLMTICYCKKKFIFEKLQTILMFLF